jgi:hypothetical protein
MIRIVLYYLAIQLNGLLVSLYLHDYMTIKVLILLQMLILGVACLEITHHKTIQSKNMTIQNRLRWSSWFCVYGCFCSLYQFSISSSD